MSLSLFARRERLGRRLGIGLFFVIVAGFTVNHSLQVLRQGFAPESGPSLGTCQQGLGQLDSALTRARNQAAVAPANEAAALDTFRRGLQPEWASRPAVGVSCRDSATGRAALLSLDELRYAEEQATRYGAEHLLRSRHRVSAALQVAGPGN